MKRVLIGTTNPSKVERFTQLLCGEDINFLTLSDLHIYDEPNENGNTPEENAVIKVRFYGSYFDYVICNDSGLYFDDLELDDIRQPGLKIRRVNGKSLNDDEMIDYYSKLVHSLGDKVTAYYMDGVAVYAKGKLMTFSQTREECRAYAFHMVSTPHSLRHPGWPLDSISKHIGSDLYFVEEDNTKEDQKDVIIRSEYRERLRTFLKESLEL